MATVLVIEDDEDAREVLCELLEFEGYDVLSATNGREGLHVASTAVVLDVIVLDLRMPLMDGREFLAEQAKVAAIKDVPVIVVSAWAKRWDVEGPRARLTKPVNLSEMFREIESAVARRAA
jgi:CheY-like chemotaxis protein